MLPKLRDDNADYHNPSYQDVNLTLFRSIRRSSSASCSAASSASSISVTLISFRTRKVTSAPYPLSHPDHTLAHPAPGVPPLPLYHLGTIPHPWTLEEESGAALGATGS